MKTKTIFYFCSLLLIAGMMTFVLADTKSGEQIKWQVVSGGGCMNGVSTNYVLSGTVGQTAVGPGTSAGYIINQGFWQDFGNGGSCCQIWGTPGDANSDHAVNLIDIFVLDRIQIQHTPGAGQSRRLQ